MKNALIALSVIVSTAATAATVAPVAEPVLRLVDNVAVVLTTPTNAKGGCPGRIVSISLTDQARPRVFWGVQRVGVALEHDSPSTCVASVSMEQWPGKLSDGQRVWASAKVGENHTPALELVASCGMAGCTLADAREAATLRDVRVFSDSDSDSPVQAAKRLGGSVGRWLSGALPSLPKAKPGQGCDTETQCANDNAGTIGDTIRAR